MHLDFTVWICRLLICNCLYSLSREAMNNKMTVNPWITTSESGKFSKVGLEGLNIGLFNTYTVHIDVVACFTGCVIDTEVAIFDETIPGHHFSSCQHWAEGK